MKAIPVASLKSVDSDDEKKGDPMDPTNQKVRPLHPQHLIYIPDIDVLASNPTLHMYIGTLSRWNTHNFG
ncbi:unnamed protein product [Larinioides sclopetarius]|uniref:Uncharacterized protein n=1 Tax=Larinioides sclopetarius TaxID=280406 RepID=A0AAV1ZT51_9ARAC